MTFDQTARKWSIVTKSKSGIVSYVRDLHLEDARSVYAALNPLKNQVWQQFYYAIDGKTLPVPPTLQDGDIELRTVIGPEGWDSEEVLAWDEWPKTYIFYVDRDGNCAEEGLKHDGNYCELKA